MDRGGWMGAAGGRGLGGGLARPLGGGRSTRRRRRRRRRSGTGSGGEEGEVKEEEEKKGCVIGHGRRETCGRLSLALARGAGRLIGRREIGGGLVGLAREKKRRTGIGSLLPRGSGRGEIGGRLMVGAMKKKKKKETTSETMLPTGAMSWVVLSGARKKKRKRSSSLLPRGSGRGEIGGSLVSGAMKKKRMTTRKARRGGAPMNGRADSVGDAKAGTRRGFRGPLGP